MEKEKNIQIKIEGNTCTVNYPEESQILKSKISEQASLIGSLTNNEDVTLTISKTTEDFLNNNKSLNNNNYNKNNLINTNEKSKLEITNISIFNSEKKNESSSYINTPKKINNTLNNLNKINNNISNNKYEKELKDSVIKKLNFDLCDSIKETETISKNKEENKSSFTYNISKNLNERYFIKEKKESNNDNKNNKSNSIVINSFENKIENNNYIKVNKSSKLLKNKSKSFHKAKNVNNRILVDSNGNSQINKNIEKNFGNIPIS